MAQVLVIFNLLAGCSSIVGLYVTLFTDYQSWVLVALFGITGFLVIYVLLVPENRLESNVRAKLIHYQNPAGRGHFSLQQGEFMVQADELNAIAFPRPFASPPSVELLQLGGSVDNVLEVQEATQHQLRLRYRSKSKNGDRTFYRWIAKGALLAEAKNVRG